MAPHNQEKKDDVLKSDGTNGIATTLTSQLDHCSSSIHTNLPVKKVIFICIIKFLNLLGSHSSFSFVECCGSF